jgi:uncharacterized protein (DUF2141 family)
MIRIFLVTAFIIVSKVNAQNITLKIEISGYKNNKGNAFVALYNTENDFLKKPFIGKISKIENQKVVVIFTNVPKGIYAVSSFHDENSNDKLDTNFMGIPKEDYAVSNNAKGFMSAPKFEKAKFTLNESKTIFMKI